MLFQVLGYIFTFRFNATQIISNNKSKDWKLTHKNISPENLVYLPKNNESSSKQDHLLKYNITKYNSSIQCCYKSLFQSFTKTSNYRSQLGSVFGPHLFYTMYIIDGVSVTYACSYLAERRRWRRGGGNSAGRRVQSQHGHLV